MLYDRLYRDPCTSFLCSALKITLSAFSFLTLYNSGHLWLLIRIVETVNHIELIYWILNNDLFFHRLEKSQDHNDDTYLSEVLRQVKTITLITVHSSS